MTTTETTGGIGKLKVEKIDREVLRKAAKKILKSEFDGKGAEYVAERLTKHFRESFEKKDLIECNDCKGVSPESLPACPYCGAKDEDEQPAKDGAKADKANGHANGKVHVAEPVDPEAAKALTNTKATKTGAAALAGTFTEKDLDAAVASVQQIKGEGATWAWKLGKQIYEAIYAPELWALRKDEAGKAKYKSFKNFCEEELGFAARTIYAYMNVSQRFSEADARTFGMSHMRHLASVPAAAEEELKQLMAGGATTRQIQEKAREARGGKVAGGVGKKKRTKAVEKASAKAAEKRAARTGGVSIILPEGKFSAKLWQKPAKKGDERKPAKRIGDRPYARIETLVEGMFLYVGVLESGSGQLVLACEVKKEEKPAKDETKASK